MKKFTIVQVDYHYCNYLREFDKKVCYNSGAKRTRPFVGILFNVEGLEYFAPLSSPKAKHQKMKNAIDFMKIAGGILGAINFNNMIPVNNNCYEVLNLDEMPSESHYYQLLSLQLYWLNRNNSKVRNKAEYLYKGYKNKTLDNKVLIRCCNFPLLEEKCLSYNLVTN